MFIVHNLQSHTTTTQTERFLIEVEVKVLNKLLSLLRLFGFIVRERGRGGREEKRRERRRG